ncbi:hypothetical protein ATCV1_z781R [Acanthocystis turfacea chlorella virus 1]|uniref:Uncharacterized protein z781R n=1 Tax=Chlorovirus heliozoae TaxID=322019 RepID=A7KA41_9PHYC|nr:hypothetical protein ATCV1_z781R [Acanthocystis turfacea chlorella virus 1]ABT16915.1 hypothetical protein ATCV1_z781R [Acanthocystis turfacea chlorella virus 1]
MVSRCFPNKHSSKVLLKNVIAFQLNRFRVIVRIEDAFLGVIRICCLCDGVPQLFRPWQGKLFVVYLSCLPRFIGRTPGVWLAKAVAPREPSGVESRTYEQFFGGNAKAEAVLHCLFGGIRNVRRVADIRVMSCRRPRAPVSIQEIVGHDVDFV